MSLYEYPKSTLVVGDLVKRKPGEYQGCGGLGLIIRRYLAGAPEHDCADVYWFNAQKVYGIGCTRIVGAYEL